MYVIFIKIYVSLGLRQLRETKRNNSRKIVNEPISVYHNLSSKWLYSCNFIIEYYWRNVKL